MTSDTVPVVLIALGVAALFGGLLWLAFAAEKKRTEALAVACQSLGFAFEPKGDLEVLRTFGDLPLYGHGHSKRLRNVMTGRAGERDVKLFDYAYTTGSGKSQHTYDQTVALFPGAGRGLPEFTLAPETIFAKIGAVFGYQDIDFDSSPEFSKHYLLRGPDEMAIRSAFGAEALAFFGREYHWQVEAKGGCVAVYRGSRRCKPEEIPAFLAEAQAVLRALVHD